MLPWLVPSGAVSNRRVVAWGLALTAFLSLCPPSAVLAQGTLLPPIPGLPTPAQLLKEYNLVPVPTPRESLEVALSNLSEVTVEGGELLEHEAKYVRYIWIEEGDTRDAQAISALVNEAVSRSPRIKRPIPVSLQVRLLREMREAEGLPKHTGKVLLQRIDLRDYCPRDEDLKTVLSVWEDFQLDPAYSFLITADNLERTAKLFPDWSGKATICRVAVGWKKEHVPEGYVHSDGQTYYDRWVKTGTNEVSLKTEEVESLSKLWAAVAVKDKDSSEIVVIRLPSLRLNLASYDRITHLCQSQAPVVSARYLTYRAMNTIQDIEAGALLYSQIYGGRYYELVGIPKSTNPKQTDEDALLEYLGVGNFKGGASADFILDQQRSDRRGAVTRSQVAGGRVRIWEALRHLRTGLTEGQGLFIRTLDIRRRDIDSGKNQLANLLRPKVAAKEIIFENANGTHAISLYNGEGKRQDVVPSDVAHDSTIPAPYTPDLQGLVACKACHQGFFADRGWRPLRNDVETIIRSGASDIFGDLGDRKSSAQATTSRLAGLYGANERTIGRMLDKARLDYDAVILQCTGPWKDSKSAQTDVVQLTAKRQVALWRNYWFDAITPAVALQEMGITLVDAGTLKEEKPDPAAKEARIAKANLALLRLVLPPDPRALILVDGREVIQEDPNLAALKAGLEISRAHWDLTRDIATERAWQHFPRLVELQAQLNVKKGKVDTPKEKDK